MLPPASAAVHPACSRQERKPRGARRLGPIVPSARDFRSGHPGGYVLGMRSMTAAFPGPATSRLMAGVSHPHPVNGGRWYRPARRPPRARSKPGLECSGTTACVAVRQESPPVSVHPPSRSRTRCRPSCGPPRRCSRGTGPTERIHAVRSGGAVAGAKEGSFAKAVAATVSTASLVRRA